MIKLLVVDDAPFVREIVRHALRATNIEIVAEAEDGQEAVDLALRLKPDVILMDIVLPLKNGIEAAKEIISKISNQKIVAFSTNDTESIVMKTLEAGCVSFLPKPFQRDELIAAIEQAAGKKPNERDFAANE
ncbi:MAG: response regulator [Bdellovibrionales bacterium]|nr:response regulator [Bdellovibrionales bacterium]